MKKLLFLLPFMAIAATGINGCSQDKRVRLTYGTLVGDKAEELEYGELATKVGRGENMLVAVYQDGLPCGCWTTFQDVLNKYVEEYDTKVYYIASTQFSDDSDKFGLTILKGTSDPTFALIKDGKKVNEYIYGKDTKPMFQTVKGLRKVVSKIAKDPQYFYVDQEYLDNALFVTKEDVVVHYIWYFCPDCNDCFPEVLLPYSKANNLSKKIWIMDLAIEGLLFDGGAINKNSPGYINFLREHKMSYYEGNETFGYDRGFVPTTQIWHNGELQDMNVYFNDAVDKNENEEYYISRSYYSEDRIANLGYTNEVIQGKVIPEEQVNISGSGDNISYSWKMDYARLYHKPILEAFLNKYVK